MVGLYFDVVLLEFFDKKERDFLRASIIFICVVIFVNIYLKFEIFFFFCRF